MEDVSISLSESEYQFLKSLCDAEIKFLVVGLSAALLQGVPAVTLDIDLWIKDLASPAFSKAVSAVGGTYIPPGLVGVNPPMLAGRDLKGFDLVTLCQGLDDFDNEYENAVKVTLREITLMVLPLERIIHSKTVANRDKDKASLPMLKAAVQLNSKQSK